jgi:hypothetical protein
VRDQLDDAEVQTNKFNPPLAPSLAFLNGGGDLLLLGDRLTEDFQNCLREKNQLDRTRDVVSRQIFFSAADGRPGGSGGAS